MEFALDAYLACDVALNAGPDSNESITRVLIKGLPVAGSQKASPQGAKMKPKVHKLGEMKWSRMEEQGTRARLGSVEACVVDGRRVKEGALSILNVECDGAG